MSSKPGKAKSPLFYGAVLLVAASSVVFGLDWTEAPLPPMHETEASVKAAKAAAVFPPAIKRVVKAAPRVVTPGPKPVAVANAKPDQNVSRTPQIMAPERVAVPALSPQPKCDIAACSAAYRSFRASDCTWQPYEGPRRFCDKGNPPAKSTSTDADAGLQVSDKCDIEACKQAYFTFNPADCTYQPYEGPRRLCTKGNPPKQEVAAAPAASTPAPADTTAPVIPAPATGTTEGADQAQPKVSNKCDIEACKQAYFTFNPADCTYQPFDGPRRLCTKGNPPKQEAAVEPAASTPSPVDAAAPVAPAPPAGATENADQAQPRVSNKCDVEACKQAYFTFNPTDCTYQPSDGPRRLCTKGNPPKQEAATAPATPAPVDAAATPSAATPSTAPAPSTETPSTAATSTAAPSTAMPAATAPAPKQEAAIAPATSTPAPIDAAAVPSAATPSTAPSSAAAPSTKTSSTAASSTAASSTAAPSTAMPAATAPAQNNSATPNANQTKAKCDIQACKRAYFTFNPADCTYQPTDGPRRLCTKGNPPKQEAAVAPATSTPPPADAAAPGAPALPTGAAPTADQAQPKVSNKCDVEACKQAYFTFNPTDCTYQPSNGPRRLCTKGNPPKPEAAAEPAAATPSTATPSTAAPAPNTAVAPSSDQAKPKCDIEACKQAYFTFNPADCTYQPTVGPRRLCTKGAPSKPQASAPAAPAPRAAAPDHPVPPGLVPSRH